MYDYDLIVIGGGTGGLPSGISGAKLGKKIAVVERDQLAGTCLNYGCTPTKVIIHSARLFKLFKDSRQFGIEYEKLKINFPKVMERTRNIVEGGRKRNEKRVEDNENITLFRESGRFINENEVQVGNQTITGDKIFISTGASSFVPNIDGLEKSGYLSYKEILNMKELPESIIVIGGGFISAEYASAFNSFGSKVTMLVRGNELIGRSDSDISKSLGEYMIEDGVDIRWGTEAERIVREGNEVRVTTKVGEIIGANELIVAVGLKPNTAGLNLEAAGVQVNSRGFIHVDDFCRTSKENIWALGDVAGRKMFTHAALKESDIVVQNAFSGTKIIFNDEMLPYAVFTTPEIGSVGLTEKECIEKGLEFKTGKAFYQDTSKGLIGGETRGFVKLIHDEKNILGCHGIGTEAGILVQEIAAIMNCPNSYESFLKITHTHPTLSEIFEDLKPSFMEKSCC